MNPFGAITALAGRLFTKAEGERITGPLAVVSVPQAGVIPMSWPLNFWQTGRNVLTGGQGAIVESCVWAYIRAIAQLPGYHRTTNAQGGIENITKGGVADLLRWPSDYQTSSDFLVHLVRSLLLNGNTYWPVSRDERGNVEAFHWTQPGQCQAIEIGVEGQAQKAIFYHVGQNPIFDFRSLVDGAVVIPRRDCLHIKLATPRHPLRGETWLSELAFELISRGVINTAQLSFFQNAARPSGILQTDLILNAVQVNELRERWNEQSRGMNSGGTPILTAGLKYEKVGVSNQDAQVIEALKLNDRMIAGVFGVPAMILGIDEGASSAKTSEAVMTEWLASGLGFLLNHIEVQIDQFLKLPASEYVEYDTRALLRSMFRERIDGLVRGTQGGVFAINEARADEGLPAKPEGDEPRVQQQLVPLSWWKKQYEMAAAKQKPAPAPKAPAAAAPAPPAEPAPIAPADQETEKQILTAVIARAMEEACHGIIDA